MPATSRTAPEGAVACRKSRMQRLHHGAEVFLQPRRFGGGDRQGMADRWRVELQEAGHRRRGSDRSERRGAVPPPLIVARVHHPAEPCLDLESDDVSVDEARAGCTVQFDGGQQRRHERRARMRERHEAHVVATGALVRTPVPSTVHRPPPSCVITSCTARLAGSDAPASVTPTVSRMAVAARLRAMAGGSAAIAKADSRGSVARPVSMLMLVEQCTRRFAQSGTEEGVVRRS